MGIVVQAQNDGLYGTGLYLYLLKAFDTLDHTLLLSKMDRYGVCGVTLDWFRNYLVNQSLVVRISDGSNKVTYSDKFDITYGTTQGSCLGPLLFVIFCNDMHLLDLYGALILFTDDTTLISSHHSKKYPEYQMYHFFKILLDWFRSNKLSLKMNKTILIRFWKNPDKVNSEFIIEGCVIPDVTQTKFLGIHVDNHLKWDYHTGQVYNKVKANQYLISMMKNLLSTANLRKLYDTHIYSHI